MNQPVSNKQSSESITRQSIIPPPILHFQCDMYPSPDAQPSPPYSLQLIYEIKMSPMSSRNYIKIRSTSIVSCNHCTRYSSAEGSSYTQCLFIVAHIVQIVDKMRPLWRRHLWIVYLSLVFYTFVTCIGSTWRSFVSYKCQCDRAKCPDARNHTHRAHSPDTTLFYVALWRSHGLAWQG